jgi:hypothetical protein
MIMHSKAALVSLVAMAILSPARAETTVIAPQDKAVNEAKAAIGDLAGQLKTALSTAMKDQGPGAAIEVCKAIAPQSASAVGEQRHLTIKRTALKVRNPTNAPDDFEARVLASFVAQAQAGGDVQALVHSQVFEADGVKQLRFMKAIPMAEQPCAACHGANVKPDVTSKTLELYPQDQAVGFLPGQVRGAFSVTVKLD